jgi:hypothetical protein
MISDRINFAIQSSEEKSLFHCSCFVLKIPEAIGFVKPNSIFAELNGCRDSPKGIRGLTVSVLVYRSDHAKIFLRSAPRHGAGRQLPQLVAHAPSAFVGHA